MGRKSYGGLGRYNAFNRHKKIRDCMSPLRVIRTSMDPGAYSGTHRDGAHLSGAHLDGAHFNGALGVVGSVIGALWLMAAPTLAAADMMDTTASAAMVSPLQITSAAPLEFGTVVIPKLGQCIYTLGPDDILQSSGGTDCTALSGTPLAANFEVGCAANVQVRFDLIYTNTAPTGASFGAGTAPMDIDGRGAGSVTQILPCDSDGQTVVRAGGTLSVTPQAPDSFSGDVGTIRLEIIYD